MDSVLVKSAESTWETFPEQAAFVKTVARGRRKRCLA
jgi:hypothetical protein